MTSMGWSLTPSEKINSGKRGFSTSFTDATLSKVTLRTHKRIKDKKDKESKAGCFPLVDREANTQTDSLSYPNEESIIHGEPSLKSGNFSKNCYYAEVDENGFKRHIANGELETLIENNELNVNELKQMSETTDDSAFSNQKKHKKKKKHKDPESCFESENNTVVSSNYFNEKSGKGSKRSRLAVDGQEAYDQTDSLLLTSKANLLNDEPVLNSSVHNSNLSYNMKANKNSLKRHTEFVEIEAQNDNSKVKEVEQVFETPNNNSCRKLKNHKKKKHEHSESYIEPADASVPSSSKDKSEKTKPLKMKSQNKTEDVILNKTSMEKAADSFKISTQLFIPKDKKPSKKKLPLSPFYVDQTFEGTVSGSNDTTHFNQKSVDKSNPNNNLKKIKRKHRLNSKEPTSNHYNCVGEYKCDKNEQASHFQNQNSIETFESSSYPNPIKKKHVSSEIFSNLSTPTKSKSFISVKQDSSENSGATNILNNEILDIGQNLKYSSAEAKHPITVFNKKKDLKGKQLTTSSIEDKPFNIDQIQQDLLAAALKSLSKSPKRNKTKKSVQTFKNGNCEKPNRETNKKRTKKVSKIIHLDKQDSNSSLQSKKLTSTPKPTLLCTSQCEDNINQVESNKNPKNKMLPEKNKKGSPSKSAKQKRLPKDAKFDIEKIQQKLLAAALKNVNSVSTESKKFKTSELFQDNITEPTKEKQKINENTKKRLEEVNENKKIVTKKKSRAKSKLDPLEYFTAKLLSAELKKRKCFKT